MHLVGGFNDDRQLSQKLTNQLLSKFTFFPLSCAKKTSSDWIWVKLVCNLSPLIEWKETWVYFEGCFLHLRTWCGEGMDLEPRLWLVCGVDALNLPFLPGLYSGL